MFEAFPGKEHALLICNHRSDIDWLVGWVLAQVLILVNIHLTRGCHCSCFLCKIVSIFILISIQDFCISKLCLTEREVKKSQTFNVSSCMVKHVILHPLHPSTKLYFILCKLKNLFNQFKVQSKF